MSNAPRTGGSWTPVFVETYPYADQAAFLAAYPAAWTWDSTPVFLMDFSATNGPGGTPGLLARRDAFHYHDISHTDDWVYGNFERRFAVTSPEFKFTARIQQQGYVLINLASFVPESAPGEFDDTNDVVLSFATGYSFASVPNLWGSYDDAGARSRSGTTFSPTINSALYAGQWPEGTTADIELIGKVSTGSDGYYEVWFNGTLLHNYNGPLGFAGRPVDFVYLAPGGHDPTDIGSKLGPWAFYVPGASTPTTLTPITASGGQCCGSTTGTGGGPTAGGTTPPDPTDDTTVWRTFCEGGGVPAIEADPTASDTYADV